MESLTRLKYFLAVVAHGGFSAAARELGRSKALISKAVADLEDELGTRLLNRTTRQFSLTPEGEMFYREAQDLVRGLDELAASLSLNREEPRGRLRVSAPRLLTDLRLGEAAMRFVAMHPLVDLDLALDDRRVDIVEEGFDLALRIGELEDSTLIARALAPFEHVICAHPDVLDAHPVRVPKDLVHAPCIRDTNFRHKGRWTLQCDGVATAVSVGGRVTTNSALLSRDAALHGLGYALVPRIVVAKDLAAGRLAAALSENWPRPVGIYAVYPHRRHLSAKVRSFVDFLADWLKGD